MATRYSCTPDLQNLSLRRRKSGSSDSVEHVEHEVRRPVERIIAERHTASSARS